MSTNDTLAIERSMERNIMAEEKRLGILGDQSTFVMDRHDRVSQDSLWNKVITQVTEKNKNDKYNFKALKNRKQSNENSMLNMMVSSSNIVIIPESQKENISTSMSNLSIEKQNASQIEIINKKTADSKETKESSYFDENQLSKPKRLLSRQKNKQNLS